MTRAAGGSSLVRGLLAGAAWLGGLAAGSAVAIAVPGATAEDSYEHQHALTEGRVVAHGDTGDLYGVRFKRLNAASAPWRDGTLVRVNLDTVPTAKEPGTLFMYELRAPDGRKWSADLRPGDTVGFSPARVQVRGLVSDPGVADRVAVVVRPWEAQRRPLPGIRLVP
ncbi:MAG: hypothetical protein GEV11_13195 [Streptosporangiales bacterium]|nr:hypothetical protein [Streptosporangiales bacterium]